MNSAHYIKTNKNKKSMLDPATRLGPVHLSVTNEERSLRFYRDILGLREIPTSKPNVICLGSDGKSELAVLHPGANGPFPKDKTGLYHFALAVPNLREFARFVARMSSLKYDHYPTDHVISKSDYLWDPDGNGIEVYTETPEDGLIKMVRNGIEVIDKNGVARSGRDPINLDWLFGHLTPKDSWKDPLSEETSMGHVHLHVSNLENSTDFYSNVIGYDRLRYIPSYRMADLTLSSYEPHRIALNTWAGEGAPPAPAGSSGLLYFTIVLPSKFELDSVIERIKQSDFKLIKDIEDDGGGYYVQDPSKNRIHLVAQGNTQV